MIKNVFKVYINERYTSVELEKRNNYLRLLLLFNYLLFQKINHTLVINKAIQWS